ncbi:MAG: hypothetical protein OXH64_12240, partial [Rhodospirillaceae bacterium]|nr:hypothetical protein [Rhodospirillaceae bacterium]
MTAPHVDFESVGHIDRAEDVGRLWWATPIALPDSGIEALLIRVFDAWSSVFPEARLRDTDPVTVGQPGQNTGLALSDVGDGTFSGHRIGHTAPTDEAPHGFLAVSATGTGRIELWHLDPADIDLDALDPALRARILPDPTEATRGRYLRQSPDGETYELVGDPPADDGADYTPRFTTLQDVRNALAPGTSGKWATGGSIPSRPRSPTCR